MESGGLAGILQDLLAAYIIPQLEGALSARYLALASAFLYLYDYFLILDDELKYFWTGRWTLTRVLYFLNRVIAIMSLSLSCLGFFGSNLSLDLCNSVMHADVVIDLLFMTTVHAILATRVYYLFSHSFAIRAFLVVVSVATVACASTFVALSWIDLEAIELNITGVSFEHMGCAIIPPKTLWRLFLPTVIIHTILFFLTTLRAVQSGRALEPSLVIKRVARDGGLFYAVVFFSVGWTTIASLLSDQPRLLIPGVFSNFMASTVSIATARLLLSIKSLGSKLTLDPDWIFNNIELNRIKARAGATDMELLVDIEAIDPLSAPGMFPDRSDSMPGRSTSQRRMMSARFGRGGVRSTRVGVVEEPGLGEFCEDREAEVGSAGGSEAWALDEMPRIPKMASFTTSLPETQESFTPTMSEF